MNDTLTVLQWSGALTGLAFMIALGGVVGSFLNVVVYRLPREQNLVHPASRCPACETPLRWRDNLPVIGWLLLRGRCRYCRTRISPEYPIVEGVVAVLFGALWAMWFMQPSIVIAIFGPGAASSARPDWVENGAMAMWPALVMHLVLVACLVAMTLIDIKTFMIPLGAAWLAAGAGLLGHTGHALWIELSHTGLTRGSPDWTWIIPTPEWPLLGATLGASAGVALSAALLWIGVMPRSFADYQAWEREAEAKVAKESAPSTAGRGPESAALRDVLVRTALLTGPAIALMFIGFAAGMRVDHPFEGMTLGMGVGLVIGLLLRRLGGAARNSADDPIWTQYPHARREMAKEILFLAPALALGALGWWLAGRFRGAEPPPLWLEALGGAALGLLVGGGQVWIVRILGTYAFGKEAMGLGDVHLMAGVGAVVGWVNALAVFFIAPFLGICWAIASLVWSRAFRRAGAALPYGPHLATATLLVVYANPLLEWVLSLIVRTPIDLP